MTVLPDPPWMMPGESHGLIALRLGLPLARHLLHRLEQATPPSETHAVDQRDQALINAYCSLYIALGEDSPGLATIIGNEVVVPLTEPVARHLQAALTVWAPDDVACAAALTQLNHWLKISEN